MQAVGEPDAIEQILFGLLIMFKRFETIIRHIERQNTKRNRRQMGNQNSILNLDLMSHKYYFSVDIPYQFRIMESLKNVLTYF